MAEERNNDEVIDAIKKFIDNKTSYFGIDRTEFIRAKNLSAGNGWFERLGRAWGEARASLTLNPLKAMVDNTMNTFLRNPIKFTAIPEDLGSDITEVLIDCLRDACDTGLGYFYMFHDEADGKNNLRFKKLDNESVMYSQDECLVLDKKRDTENSRSKSTVWSANDNILNLQTDEYAVLTYFRKTQNGITIYKIEGDEIVTQLELPLSRIPIVLIKNKAVQLKNEVHWRGYYYEFQDAVALMNACTSKIAEISIARAPVALSEEALAGNEEYIKQWTSNEPRNAYIYKATSIVNVNGTNTLVNNPAPIFAPNAQDLEMLNSTVVALRQYIEQGTGTNMSSENTGSETATAVMLRRENKQAALSEMLRNLQNASKEIKILLGEYLAILGFQLEEPIRVIDEFQESFDNQRALDLLMSLQQSGIPPMIQVQMLSLYSAPAELVQAVQQFAEQQQDPEKQQLQQQVQELSMQLQQQQQLVEATKIQAAQSYNIRMEELLLEKQIKEREFQIKNRELDLKEMELGIKKGETIAKLDQSQQKIDIDALKE